MEDKKDKKISKNLMGRDISSLYSFNSHSLWEKSQIQMCSVCLDSQSE